MNERPEKKNFPDQIKMQSIVGKLGSSLFGPLGPALHSSLIKAQVRAFVGAS